jgi:hypothetical protein
MTALAAGAVMAVLLAITIGSEADSAHAILVEQGEIEGIPWKATISRQHSAQCVSVEVGSGMVPERTLGCEELVPKRYWSLPTVASVGTAAAHNKLLFFFVSPKVQHFNVRIAEPKGDHRWLRVVGHTVNENASQKAGFPQRVGYGLFVGKGIVRNDVCVERVIVFGRAMQPLERSPRIVCGR